MLNILTRGELA